MSQFKNLKELFSSINKNLKNNIKLKDLLDDVKKYNGDDWKKYIKKNSLTYNRHIVYKNDLLELVIITWDSEQETPVHGHPKNGCIFKILSGNINTCLYKTLDTKIIERIFNLKFGDTRYIDNTVSFHSMSNNYDNLCVSLHIYSPPYPLKTSNLDVDY